MEPIKRKVIDVMGRIHCPTNKVSITNKGMNVNAYYYGFQLKLIFNRNKQGYRLEVITPKGKTWENYKDKEFDKFKSEVIRIVSSYFNFYLPEMEAGVNWMTE